MRFRAGMMELDPSPGATPAISAARALRAAGGEQPGNVPDVLLGRLTVSDYGTGSTSGFHPLVDHRLVWFVLYHHAKLKQRGCHGACPPIDGTEAVPVDANTGESLGDWGWSGA